MATARGRKGVGEEGGVMRGFTANQVKRGCRVTWHAAAARTSKTKVLQLEVYAKIQCVRPPGG